MNHFRGESNGRLREVGAEELRGRKELLSM